MLTSPRAVREISGSSILAEQERLIAVPNPLLDGSRERLTLHHAWRPWTSFRLGRVFSSLGVCLRRKSRIAARIAGPAIILCALPGFASAQDATWQGPGSDWHTPGNWNNGVPTGVGTFNGALPTSISMAGGVTIDALQFDAPNYIFDVPNGLTINGTGIAASVANAPTFNVNSVSSPGIQAPRSCSTAVVRLARRKSFWAQQLIQPVSLRASQISSEAARLARRLLQ